MNGLNFLLELKKFTLINLISRKKDHHYCFETKMPLATSALLLFPGKKQRVTSKKRAALNSKLKLVNISALTQNSEKSVYIGVVLFHHITMKISKLIPVTDFINFFRNVIVQSIRKPFSNSLQHLKMQFFEK